MDAMATEPVSRPVTATCSPAPYSADLDSPYCSSGTTCSDDPPSPISTLDLGNGYSELSVCQPMGLVAPVMPGFGKHFQNLIHQESWISVSRAIFRRADTLGDVFAMLALTELKGALSAWQSAVCMKVEPSSTVVLNSESLSNG